MNIAVIGSGGREHAIIKKLRENKNINTIYALPGNGGMGADAECVNISATDAKNIVRFCLENGVDFAVVAPDDPLVQGVADELEAAGVPCFGPCARAALIEGSKVFSKGLMKKYGIPTAAYEVFDNAKDALKYLESAVMPAVIKADGLALGKGVIIAEDLNAARNAVKTIMEDKKFGQSGSKIVIEEYLTGQEVTVLAFTDGKTLVPMPSSTDHKRAKDGDVGLNTGGMGVISPNPYYTPEIAERCVNEIFMPTIKAMEKEGRVFKGCLYFGLMLTQVGPKVIEYNCRFGDPEAQAVLPLLKTDLLSIMRACRDGSLSKIDIEFSNDASCCVVMASDGYPEEYKKGFEIKFDGEIDGHVFAAGVREANGALYTNGGRVLGVTAVAENLPEAIDKAYMEIKKISFDNAFYRKDIGKRALNGI